MKVTVKEGNYRSGTKFWRVTCRLPDGQLDRRFFPDEQSAVKHVAYRQSESRDASMIPDALKFEADECDLRLRPHGWTLRRATDYVMKHVIPFAQKPPIREAVKKYLEEQAARGLAKPTMDGKKHRSRAFVAKFGHRHLHELTLDDYSGWMQELSKSHEPRGVCHFLSWTSSFINWAVPRGYCASNLITALSWPRVKQKKPVIFTLAQVQTLFEIAPRHGLLAWAVLGTLAGIRPGEMQLLGCLGDIINLAEGYIKVDDERFSPAERRVLDLEGDWREALTAWLHRCPPEASIVPWPERRHVEALRGELGFWSPDVMRHTAASAHYARFADVGKAMKMLGHSGNSEVFHKHYKGLMTRAEAKAIYALRPG